MERLRRIEAELREREKDAENAKEGLKERVEEVDRMEKKLTKELRALRDARDEQWRDFAVKWKLALEAAAKIEQKEMELRVDKSVKLSSELTTRKKKIVAAEDLKEVDEMLGRSYDIMGYLLKCAVTNSKTPEAAEEK